LPPVGASEVAGAESHGTEPNEVVDIASALEGTVPRTEQTNSDEAVDAKTAPETPQLT
jgi:hypothetical protein